MISYKNKHMTNVYVYCVLFVLPPPAVSQMPTRRSWWLYKEWERLRGPLSIIDHMTDYGQQQGVPSPPPVPAVPRSRSPPHLDSNHNPGHGCSDRPHDRVVSLGAGRDGSDDRLVRHAHHSGLPVQLKRHLRLFSWGWGLD